MITQVQGFGVAVQVRVLPADQPTNVAIGWDPSRGWFVDHADALRFDFANAALAAAKQYVVTLGRELDTTTEEPR